MKTKNKLDHKLLGGKVVDLKKPMPQRKPNKSMSGQELLNKAFYKTPIVKSQKEKADEAWSKLLKK